MLCFGIQTFGPQDEWMVGTDESTELPHVMPHDFPYRYQIFIRK